MTRLHKRRKKDCCPDMTTVYLLFQQDYNLQHIYKIFATNAIHLTAIEKRAMSTEKKRNRRVKKIITVGLDMSIAIIGSRAPSLSSS